MKKILDFKSFEETNLIKQALEQIEDWVVVTNIEGVVLYINAAAERISGYKKEELLGGKLNNIKSNVMPDEVYRNLWHNLLNGDTFECVFVNTHKAGHLYYVANSIYPIRGEDGGLQCFISIGKEIHKEDALTQQIHDAMHYDRLTGLLNRSSFIRNIDRIKWAKENVTVIVIKIRRLGIINKQYGFNHGEYSIKEVSDRIHSILEKDVMLSRIDGNVLAFSLIDCPSIHKIVSLIKKIEGLFHEPVNIKGERIRSC